jgi:hypothetical protein
LRKEVIGGWSERVESCSCFRREGVGFEKESAKIEKEELVVVEGERGEERVYF